MMALANTIEVGDRIVLRDGKTVVEVIDVVLRARSNLIADVETILETVELGWTDPGKERRYAIYDATDEIERISQ